MDAEQGYWQRVWWLLKKSVDWAIRCVGLFGIAIGAFTTYEHFFSSTKSTIPMNIAGLTIWQFGAVILFFGFWGSFIIFTIDYFIGKHGKGIVFKKSIKMPTGQANEIFNGIQAMDTEKIVTLFDGVSKLSPEQILALFWGNKEDGQNGQAKEGAKD